MTDLYDFSKHEDMFQCVDALTRASATLAGSDMELAHELTRITNSLISWMENGVQQRNDLPGGEITKPVDLSDLTATRREQPEVDPSASDSIIDVLTGKEVKS